MSVTALDGQMSIQDPRNPVLQEVYHHPDYRVVAAFLLGWVLISSAYYALSSRLLRDLPQRAVRLCMCKRDKKRDKDVEAAEDDIEKEDFSSRPPSQQEVDASASLFILNLCFVLAALASFCSLLNMGGGTGISVGCTIVIAWSSMASQSVRIVGLLMLSWRLRRLGAKQLEVYALWFGLFIVLGLVFAVNATGTGAVSVLGPSGVSICYRQYFWPVALTLSGVVMFLEIYVAVRLFLVGSPTATTWLGGLGRIFSIEVARPMSLFVLDAATVIQAAIWVDSLAQFVPFSLASLLVIGVFNYHGRVREGVTCLDDSPPSRRISGYTDRRFSTRPNSLLEPSPFLLHFMERPMSPDSHAHTVPVRSRPAMAHADGQDGDFVLHISTATSEDQDAVAVEPPRSAPAHLSESPQPLQSATRHILPFQVQYVERLEREAAAVQTGPVPPRRDRPKVFVVIDEDEQGTSTANAIRRSRQSIIGSDIIRMTPTTTPRKKRRFSILLSPESATPSANPYRSPRDSHSTSRTQRTSFSPYPHVQRSPTVQSEHAEHCVSPSSDYLSPEGTPRHFSWRVGMSRQQSVTSSRTAPRDELPTVMEGSSTIRTLSTPSRVPSRVQTRRLTFGQPVKPPPRRVNTAAARNALPPIVVPPPLVSRAASTGSMRSGPSPLPSADIPPVPPMPSPLLLSPVGGSKNVRGPRPSPSAGNSPATSPRVSVVGESSNNDNRDSQGSS
ncbi:hypothetical protein FOMPIDRAFT_160287 [Fomitopsis schrenkii]|uniref:Transmembrane protein n=1 Tax=Fomitopsis schrenkii TaxID=2126942 RepID=S8FRD7_FOMSC|nr:hypothetical protein FOMPIDRAFT_160287 [Fomitopsis schrenkii]